MYCIALYRTILYCTVPYCTVLLSCPILSCLVLHCTVLILYCTVLYWTELNCTELNWTELYWTELNWTVLYCVILSFVYLSTSNLIYGHSFFLKNQALNLLKALSYLHANGIVHGAVLPMNVVFPVANDCPGWVGSCRLAFFHIGEWVQSSTITHSPMAAHHISHSTALMCTWRIYFTELNWH